MAGENVTLVAQPSSGTASSSTATSSTTSSSDQWRVFLGLALLAASYVFRVEVVRFSLRVARRVLPSMFVWIREFEKNLLRPLSWVVFVLLAWFSVYVMDLESLTHMKAGTLTGIVTLLLGLPLIWTVICFCNYVTWGIIRMKGWNKAVSKDDDDYSRVMIITEGIGVIKVLLVASVVSTCIVDEIGHFTDFDSSQISTVAVIMVEFVFVFGAHSWLKNILGGLMALQDEQIKSGSHVSFQGHEGVVERLFLQGFSLRQYDKGLTYIPNGMVLENAVTVQSKTIDRRVVVAVHLNHATPAATLRVFIQEIDNYLLQHMSERKAGLKGDVLGLEKPRGGWDIFNVYERSKLLALEEQGAHPQGRFWISIEAPYVVHIVYYSHERHLKALMAEKTEIVLQTTELLTKLKLALHGQEENCSSTFAAAAAPSSTETSRPTYPQRRASSGAPAETTSASHAPASEPLMRRNASDGNVLRHRRPQGERVDLL